MKKENVFRKKYVCALLLALLLAGLTGCGSSYYSAATESAAMDSGAVDYAAAKNGVLSMADYDEAPAAGEAAYEEESGSSPQMDDAVRTDKKLIRNVNLDVETMEYDRFLREISGQIETLGGYVEFLDTSGSSINGSSARSGSLTARIPCDRLDAFLGAVAERSNVTYRSESVEDVTLRYVDLETHKKALTAERDRLLELMERADTITDVIEIEGRLSEIRYQIESMETQLRTIDNQVSYSTVYISFREVKALTPVEERTVWRRIQEEFSKNLRKVGADLQEFFVSWIIHLPFFFVWMALLAVFGIAAGVIGCLCFGRKTKTKKQKQQKEEKKGGTDGN